LFTNLKQEIPEKDNLNVVYKIDCLNCSQCYIGQTKNYLNTRLNSHKNDIKNRHQKTALATHAIENLHRFDFDNVKILNHVPNYNKRLFTEMSQILNNNTVNFQTDIANLSNIYHNLIKN
jgi:GIY-YIG catalytic domain.